MSQASQAFGLLRKHQCARQTQPGVFFRIDLSYSNGNCSTQADPPLRLQERLQHRQSATGRRSDFPE